MTSTLLITIPTTRILQDHAEYGVSCALNAAAAGGGTVVVWRRYKDFEHLRSALIRASPTLPVPNLPPKHSWWTSRSAQIVNERQRQLEAFLREVEAGIERPSQAWNVFCHFINVSASISTSLVPVSRRESEDVTNVLREEVLRLQNQLSLLEDEENKLKLDLAAKDAELNNLRGRRIDAKQIKEQTVQLEKEKNHLLVEVARLEALLNSTGEQQAELNLLKEENTRLANDISILEGERNDLKTALERHEELVGSLRREISRLEDESKKMQDEIARLQHNLESNPAQENLRAEVNRLRKEKGELELEIARLETAQQSAASYGASVLAKLEKVEKEKAEQQAQAKATIEAEAKITNQLRERIEQLQKELKAAKENLALASRDIDIANNHTQEVMAANQLLKTSLDGEESELQTLRNELQSTRDKLATVYAEYEILKAKSLSGEDEIGSKLEYLAKQATEYKTESEKNANIKVKLAARVDTLVAENLHLKEKNLSLERRLKLLQGD